MAVAVLQDQDLQGLVLKDLPATQHVGTVTLLHECRLILHQTLANLLDLRIGLPLDLLQVHQFYCKLLPLLVMC